MGYCNVCLKNMNNDTVVKCVICGAPMHEKCAEHCIECGETLCPDCAVRNRGRCKSCFDVNKPFKRIRRSYLQDYVHCPYNLFLNAVMGKVPPMGGAAEAGILVHSILEDRQNGKLDINYAEDRFTEEVEAWNKGLAGKDPKEFEYSLVTDEKLQNGKDGIWCWENHVAPMLRNGEFKTEYNIKFDVEEESMIGCTLDRIEWDEDGEIHIHDWKTGKPLAGQQLIKNLQPGVYIYAIYKQFGKWPASFTLHYIGEKYINKTYNRTGDGLYEIRTTKNIYNLNVMETIAHCKKIIRHINAGEFPANGKKWFCDGMCWYSKSGECKTYDGPR